MDLRVGHKIRHICRERGAMLWSCSSCSDRIGGVSSRHYRPSMRVLPQSSSGVYCTSKEYCDEATPAATVVLATGITPHAVAQLRIPRGLQSRFEYSGA